MNGLLNINKPSGITSRDVVNQIQRRIRPTKVGHAGTLDPLASGVLVVTVGKATRLTEYVQRMPKTYRATFQLGVSSDTEDVTGDVLPLENPPIPTREEILSALPTFTGEIAQRPPNYSAKKVKGKRAYELARSGKIVELAARTITIHEIEVGAYDYPNLGLSIRCGSGTYIRSLGRDLAESLNTAAVMSGLVRTSIGRFTIENAQTLEQLKECELNSQLKPLSIAVATLPMITLSDAEVDRVSFGHAIQRSELKDPEVSALLPNGELAAILERRPIGYQPTRNFIAKS